MVTVHALVATGVNADGHREILGLDVASAEDGAGGWRFCADWSPAACPACSRAAVDDAEIIMAVTTLWGSCAPITFNRNRGRSRSARHRARPGRGRF